MQRYVTEGATISYTHKSFLLQDLEQFALDREAKVSMEVQTGPQRGPVFQRVHQRFLPQVAKQLAFDDLRVGLLMVPGVLQLQRYTTEGATVQYQHETFLVQDLVDVPMSSNEPEKKKLRKS